jgi:phosphoribosyl 1,2-cyclic phosphate phosphodiesterase
VKITVLGSGTSHGVPFIGCTCAVCTSVDPRDKRTRPSILIDLETDGPTRYVLVDTSTDLRQQCLANGVTRVDAILFTHAHADHVCGFDDIRRFNRLQNAPLACFGSAATLADLRRTFAYAFAPATQQGGGLPQARLLTLGGGPFCLGRVEVVPVPVMHGRLPVLGFRIGSFAYLTDCNAIPDASWPLLDGVTTLVLDALRRRPHSTHFNLDEAVAVVRRLGAPRAYFTHVSHDLAHAGTCASLPPGIDLAYDGQVIEVAL